MKIESQYSFDVFTRYASGTNHARCNAYRASSTNCAREAAKSAAWKHFRGMCAMMKINPDHYGLGVVETGCGIYQAIFTLVP